MAPFFPVAPPCVVHEDDDLLVVDRPAGWPVRRVSRWDGEGLLDWLTHREPRWAALGAPDPLDDAVSGLRVFSLNPAAHRHLAARFASGQVRRTLVRQGARVHSAGLDLQRPGTGAMLSLSAPPDWATPAPRQRRAALIDPAGTTAWRALHGAADGEPGWYVDRLGEWDLVQGTREPGAADLDRLAAGPGSRGRYFKQLRKELAGKPAAETSPRHLDGLAAPDRFLVRENGVTYELAFTEGYSTGLFLDQRDNRRRLLTGHVGAGFSLWQAASSAGPAVLNCFAYTCGFSVAAALGGARTTSLDLSRKYLDWGRRNFALNGLDPGAHDFIYGDVFDWLKRLARKERLFDLVVLDPPTFSRSPGRRDFRAVADYGRLVTLALPLLKPGGVLLASTNAATLAPQDFLQQVRGASEAAGRGTERELYVPQPPDFPVAPDEPAYLKSVWLRLAGG